METARPQPLSVFALLARWLTFASVLVACARRASNMNKARAPEAWACAEQLELCARSALLELMRDLRDVQSVEETLDGEATHAFRRLSVVAGTLIALAFFAQHLKAQLAGRGASEVFEAGSTVPDAALKLEGLGRAEPGYLDSS